MKISLNNLNGWQRLWALCSFLLFALLLTLSFTGDVGAPEYANVAHEKAFFDRMTDKAKEQLVIEDPALDTPEQYATWIVANATKKGTPEFDKVANLYQRSKDYEKAKELSVIVNMPNNYGLHIKKEYIDNLAKTTLSLKEYAAILKSELLKLQIFFFIQLFLIWLVVIAGSYFGGWALNWVYKGFKK